MTKTVKEFTQINKRRLRRFPALAIIIFFSMLTAAAAEESPVHDRAGDFINLGIKFYNKMLYRDAKGYFQDALKASPRRTEKNFALYALAVLKKYAAQLNEIEELNRRLGRAPAADRPAMIFELKNMHMRMGKMLLDDEGYVAIVKSHFDYVVLRDPTNPRALLYLGDINYAGMLYKDAIDDYKKVLEVYPNNAFFRERLGDIYAGTGDYDNAGKNYEEAIRIFKRTKLRDRKERVESLKKLIGALPCPFTQLQELMDQKQFEEVVSSCKKRIALNPGDVTAITYMGMALGELGSWQKAERLYKNAIKLNAKYPLPHYCLGRIYLLQRKDPDGAIEEISTARAGYEDELKGNAQAKDGVAAATRTLIYIYHEILRDYNAAVKEGGYLLQIAPEDQEAHYNLGVSFMFLNKKSMAYEEFKKTIDINPGSKTAYDAKSAIEQMQRYPDLRTLPYHDSGEN